MDMLDFGSALESIGGIADRQGSLLLVITALPLVLCLVRGALPAFVAIIVFVAAVALIWFQVEATIVAFVLISASASIIAVDTHFARRRLARVEARLASTTDALHVLETAEERRQMLMSRQPFEGSDHTGNYGTTEAARAISDHSAS